MSWPLRIVASVVLLLVGAAGALAFLNDPEPSLAEAVPDENLVVAVISGQADGRSETSVTLTWGPEESLRAPSGWTGIVTSVASQNGGTIVEGDRPISVDGVDRIALATAMPLYRPIVAGTTGLDIAEVRYALERIGWLEESSAADRPERADVELLSSLAELGRSLGFVGRSLTLAPSWTIWLPAPSFPITAMSVEAGSAAPTTGEVIARGEPQLVGASIGIDLPPGGGDFALSVEGTPPVALNGRDVVESDLVSLTHSLLELGIDPELPEPLFGEITRPTPLTVLRVQASAVAVSASGGACVWRPDGELVHVELLDSQLGVSDLSATGDLGPGDRVLAYPSEQRRTEC